ncbi:Maf family protein [Kiritimatiellota bacterium B12222]|nr:Maf family protein [Kiritimatiellota bacterium B12222]
MKLVLASASPRRAELLRSAGLEFEQRSADVDESPLRHEGAEAMVLRLSKLKAQAVAQDFPESRVLAADTVVVLEGEVLGKPQDEADAVRMLTALSGRSHEVMTGFALCGSVGPEISTCVRTSVCFRVLSAEEIRAYVASGDPMDKAGAYGIQSGAAGFVASIVGSYSNVVGLPLAQVIEFLNQT